MADYRVDAKKRDGVYHLLAAGALCALLLVALCLDAYAADPLPQAGQDLVAQAERFRQEYSMERQIREKRQDAPSVEYKEEEVLPAGPPISFELRSVQVTGVTIVDTAGLNFTWEPYVGKKIGFTELHAIAAMIKKVYKDLGYLTTATFLPPQDIKNGEVEIRIMEGKRGDLIVDGNKYFSTSSIAKYFHTFRGEPLDMVEIQKDVMRLNENRDLKVSAVLSTGAKPETVDVTLKTKEAAPYHVTVGTDNQGSRLTGRYRESVAFNTSNLTGNHDDLSINAVISDLSTGEFVSYQMPVGTYGTKLGMDVGLFQAKLGQEYKRFDIVTATQYYNPNVTVELYQSQNLQVDVQSGVKIKNTIKKQARDKVTDERLRLPYAGLEIVENDAQGQTNFSPELSGGSPGLLGSSRRDNPLASRRGSDGSFLKYSQNLNRYQTMPWGSYVQLKSQVQYATEVLPTSEQLQLGGANSVRGYPEGDYLADSGANLNMDWYFPLYPVPASWKAGDFSFRNNIEPLVFFDMGGGRLNKAYGTEKSEKMLAGFGGGVKVRVKNNAHVKLEWAKAIGDKPVRGTGPSTFNMSVQCGM